MIFYFSGTGNSHLIATHLGKAVSDDVHSIVGAPSLSECDRLGIVLPVHAWGPPRPVVDFINRLSLLRPPRYLYVVLTCGDDIGRTDKILRRLFRQRGLSIDAIWSLQMPNTYVAFPGFDTDHEPLVQSKMKYALEKSEDIAHCVKEELKGIREVHPGMLPWTKSYILRPLWKRCCTSPRKFRTSESCVGCGKCRQVCPMHNIYLKDGRPQWGGDCTMCLACYHHCPTRSIEYGKFTKGKRQYTNKWEAGEKERT